MIEAAIFCIRIASAANHAKRYIGSDDSSGRGWHEAAMNIV